jgi:tRNA (guanine-N7-)-methyltransferase
MMTEQFIRSIEQVDLHDGQVTLTAMPGAASSPQPSSRPQVAAGSAVTGSHAGSGSSVRHSDPHFTTDTAPTTGRAARSFRPRSGRMSATKHRAIADLLPRYLIEPKAGDDLQQRFGRDGALCLDIGFGMGESTLALAAARPDWNILAIDIHLAGHALLAQGLDREGHTNVRIVAADAHEVLLWMVAQRSVSEVHIWFSDPWPKQAQSWRRLIQPDFLALVSSRLVVGGAVRMATDWQPYADQMRRSIASTPTLDNPYDVNGGWAPRHEIRPVTSYERKGIAAGRTIRDLVAIAIEPSA